MRPGGECNRRRPIAWRKRHSRNQRSTGEMKDHAALPCAKRTALIVWRAVSSASRMGRSAREAAIGRNDGAKQRGRISMRTFVRLVDRRRTTMCAVPGLHE